MKRKRPLDWVVQPEAYGLGAYELTPTVVGGIGFEFFEVPLTVHQDWAADGDAIVGPDTVISQRRVPQLEQTVVRIKGSIHVWLNPAEEWWSTLNGSLTARCRIRKTSQRVQSVDPVDPGGGGDPAIIMGASMANEEFLWEDFKVFIASSSWGTTDVSPMLVPQRFDIDVRTQRRLRVNEHIALQLAVVSENVFGGGPGAWPVVAFKPQLRCLMRTIT